MDRKSDIIKIKYYLKKNGMTLNDIGVDGTFKTISDDVILDILNDIYEDEAREEYDRYLEQESFNTMLDDMTLDEDY